MFGRAVSALVAKVAAWFFDRESQEMTNLGGKSLDIPNMGRDISVAPPSFRSQKSRLIIVVAKVWK